MKKSLLGLIFLFVLLTTYSPKSKIFSKSNLNIQNIIIENNTMIANKEILDDLVFYIKKIYIF